MTIKRDSVHLAGYCLHEQLHQGPRTTVYRAVSSKSVEAQPVIIKLLMAEHPSDQELLQFQHQYKVIKNLEIPGIVRPLELLPYQRGYALVMEDCDSVSLAQYRTRHALALGQILHIGVQLAEILHGLHQQHVIHKDINPANIVIHPVTHQVKLIDFGIASVLSREIQDTLSPELLEGTLAYLSPEQTGRMNRGIDYRTDFYALGVTLYELLTDTLPFTGNDAMELVYSHLTQVATPIHQVNPKVPEPISQIVAKLMAKNVEDRYRSALGLKNDLENCLKQWENAGVISEFEIGQRDLSDRLLIPEKLYGREREVKALLDAFDRVSHGGAELFLIAGFSGIGKTAVVNEVQKPIARQRGSFIQGKYDQFNRNIPLSAFVQALRNLMGQLLARSDEQLTRWKAEILSALGENGQVLVEVIPELENVIGKQPPALELSGSAAQQRFNALFQKFIGVLATPEHPLVLFLDDLQWADSASLELLAVLMDRNKFLMIVGAYRDNEVTTIHPLMLAVTELTSAGAAINTVTLQPLSLADVGQLLADTLCCDLRNAADHSSSLIEPLTDLVHQKTQGNPFFISQFLKALYQDGSIQLDPETGRWQCDIDQARFTHADDVVELVSSQLQKLPTAALDILKLASCIGATFDLSTLAITAQHSSEKTAATLWAAVQEGFVIPTVESYRLLTQSAADGPSNSHKTSYRFLHDRVQQAAYSLIPDSQRQAVHLSIGRLLLNNPALKQEEVLFEIVNHLNEGSALIDQPQERESLAQLNLSAGRKAKASNANRSANAYFEQGIQLLPTNSWAELYDLTLALHEEISNTSLLNSDFEQVKKWNSVVCQQVRTLLDTVKVQQNCIFAANVQGRFPEALDIGLSFLRALGVEFPAQPTQTEVGEAFARTRSLWIENPISSLLDLPLLNDPELIAQMEVLTVLSPAAYVTNQSLLALLNFKQIEISIQFGNCPASVFAYADHGAILCGVIGDLGHGYRFGELALDLRERLNLVSFKCRSEFIVNYCIKHWKESLSNIVLTLKDAFQNGIETGGGEHASLNAIAYCSYAYYQGQTLTELLPTIQTFEKIFLEQKHLHNLSFQGIHHQAVINLVGSSLHPERLTGEVFNAEIMLPLMQAKKAYSVMCKWYVNQIILYYLFDKYDEAADTCAVAAQYLESCSATFESVLYTWYDALIQLSRYPSADSKERQIISQQVQAQQDKLQRWAAFAPTNHQHRWELVAAEKSRVEGNLLEAIEYYDRAIASTKANGFIQDEALANELAAKFYLAWEKEKFAALHMQEAYYCYKRWGASAKANDLENRYPELLSPIILAGQHFSGQRSTSCSARNSSASLDLAMLSKASQAIFGEIELNSLLKTLLTITLENAGADRGALILQTDLGLQIWALLDSEQPEKIEQTTFKQTPVELSEDVAISVVNLVKNSLEPVILACAREGNRFADDRHLLLHQPQSVLCSPILHQGKLLGIIYLENRQTGNVFTPERLEVLTILCSQAAIALENARLFQAEQEKAQSLKSSLDQLQQSEQRFQSLFEKSTDAIILLDSQGFIDCNPAAVELFGYQDKHEVRSLHHADLAPEFQAEGQRSFDVANAHIAAAFTKGSHRFEWIHQRSDRKPFWAEVVLTPISWDGAQILHAIVRDISDRKQVESDLIKSESQFRSLVEDASDLIYSFSPDGIFTYISPQVTEICGYHAAELIGKSCADLIHPDDISLMTADFQQLLQTEQKQSGLELRIPRKDGGWCWVVFNNSPIKDAAGQMIGVQGIGRDVTAQRAALLERQRQADALKAIVEGTAGKTGADF